MEYTYELIENQQGSLVKRTDSEQKIWWIPADPSNSDYQDYLAQLDDTPTQIETE